MGLLGPHSVIAPPPPAPTSSLARVTLTANGPGVQHLGRAMLTTKARGGGGVPTPQLRHAPATMRTTNYELGPPATMATQGCQATM